MTPQPQPSISETPKTSTPTPTPTPTPTSPLRVRSSQLREYISKRRWWLWTGVVLVLSAMVIGVIFVAHKFYVELGGQGFLKAREEPLGLASPTIFLPQRQTRLEKQARGKNVPYYACGDQLDSCLAYAKPNICCPVTTYCHGPTSDSLSGIFCCNATSPSDCHVSKNNPPQCPRNTFQCSAQTGGGCCETNTICTPNGCVRILAPSIISDGTNSSTKTTAKPYSDITSIQNGNAAFPTGSTIVSTVTERPAATITEIKQGEVAQNGVPHQHSVFVSLYLPYIMASLAVFVVLVMGYL